MAEGEIGRGQALMAPHPRDHSGYGKKTCQFSPTLGTREGTRFGYRTLLSRRRLLEWMARLAANDGRAPVGLLKLSRDTPPPVELASTSGPACRP